MTQYLADDAHFREVITQERHVTVRKNALQRGWSPVLKGDRPEKRPPAWTVLGFERRLSGKTPSGVDSRGFHRGTVRAGAPRHG